MDAELIKKYNFYINELSLQPHPEGGYYARTYESKEVIQKNALPDLFTGDRHISSAIYFLLQGDQYSAFHRIKSDELWHHYDGCGLCIYVIHPDGRGEQLMLGNELEKGFRFQHVVPAGVWFASKPVEKDAFTLCGCTVSPGFDFDDFEMGNKESLLAQYPEHKKWIDVLSIHSK
ncbi:MAG: cupin domain-containing protein [Bacteroidota bacterium]